ncbi:MAG: hypothetical protein ACK5PS_19465 [Desulfopila sp.]
MNNDQNKAWPRVLAFQLPIIMLGIPAVFPALIKVSVKLGLFGDELTSHIDSVSYFQFFTLSLFALGPVVAAFGTELRFSITRYIAGFVVLGLLAFLTVAQALSSGTGISFPVVPAGAGLLGIAVAAGLGYTGLALYNAYCTDLGRRIMIGAVSLMVAGGIVIGGHELYQTQRQEAKRQVRIFDERKLANEFWIGTLEELGRQGSSLPLEKRLKTRRERGERYWRENQYWKLSKTISLSSKYPRSPCVELRFESIKRKPNPYYMRLEREKQKIEKQFNSTLIWTKPKRQKVHAGKYANERGMASLTSISDGIIRTCMETANGERHPPIQDQEDWPSRQRWLAQQLIAMHNIITSRWGFENSAKR